MIKTIQTTEDYSLERFDLHFYYDQVVKESNGELYQDNGKTPKAFENGVYEIIRFTSELKSNEINISVKSEIGSLNNRIPKEMTLIIHALENSPKKVLVNGKKVAFTYVDNKLSVVSKIEKKDKIKICL